MKNIRINKNIFNKKKLVLITIPIVATLILSGCSFGANGERAKYSYTGNIPPQTYNYTTETTPQETISNDLVFEAPNQNNTNYTTETPKNELNIPLKDIGAIDLRNVRINYNSAQHANFISYLNGVDAIYVYSEFYNLDEALVEYNKLKLDNYHNFDLKNIDSTELYNIILENNKEYKKVNKSSIYKEIDNKEIIKIVNIIITTVNDFIKLNDDISVDRIKCVLSDLKLFQQKSAMSNAFVTNDNCLIISPNMMQFANTINGRGTDEDVIKHEIIHLLQKGCNCDLNQNDNLKRNFGICYGFKNIEINSLDFTWFYEASAEKNMANYTGHDILVYKNMIGYLESLSITNLVKDTYKVNDTENLSFKRNLEDLYNYFGVSTPKEKREILNLMYSLEVMHMEPSDFYNTLEKKTGKNKDANLRDEINYTVKSSICETLTKLFYKNLSQNIVNKDVSLGDIFYLISLFENDINNHILYDSDKKYSYNEHFINTYLDIQDNFFFELSNIINCSQEELENSYNNYNSYIQVGETVVKNYNLTFLSKDKVNYLTEREKELNNISGPTVRYVNDNFFTKNSKKVYN